MKPTWLAEAEKYIGTREIKGMRHEPLIVGWWKKIKRGGIKTDEVPWCAAFVGAMLEECGIVSSRFESARSYLTWGVRLARPMYGCIVVFSRNGGGHVGFLYGKDSIGRLLILGGNQADMVSVKPFLVDGRVLGYFWPKLIPQTLAEIPVYHSYASAPISTRES
jgi:uncharacterized protein (TIGR02594 family)